MRVVFYVRVSTNEQTVAPQLDALEAYATARGFDVVDVYTDEGISGSKDRRPALDEMMSKAKRRSFDAIAIVKLDRLARSTRHLTQLAAELEAWGVDLIVLDQGVDTSTPSGKLLFAILGAIGEFELDLIRERTRAGMRAAQRRGKRIGRPRAYVDRVKLLQGAQRGESISALSRELGVSRHVVRQAWTEMGLSERLSVASPVTMREVELPESA